MATTLYWLERAVPAPDADRRERSMKEGVRCKLQRRLDRYAKACGEDWPAILAATQGWLDACAAAGYDAIWYFPRWHNLVSWIRAGY